MTEIRLSGENDVRVQIADGRSADAITFSAPTNNP
jgi:hypothetical protein